MVNIEQYIIELLYENDCVIIPGLGSFVAEYNPAQISDNQEIVLPPSKKITFNYQIKTDDGLLADYITLSTGISAFEAVKRVEEFREECQYRLERGEDVEITGLGFLKMDDENHIVLSAERGNNYLLNSYGLGTVSIYPNKRVPDMAAPPVPLKRKKNKFWYLWLMVPVLVSGVYIYLSLFSGEKKESNSPPVQQEETGPNLSEENVIAVDQDTTGRQPALKNDEVIDSSIVISEEKQEVQNTEVKINYYLIGNSFAESENAQSYINRIRNMGYQPVDLGKQGNFYVVAIGGYETYDQAIEAKYAFVDRFPDSGVYILKARN